MSNANDSRPREWAILISKGTGQLALPGTKVNPVEIVNVVERSALDAALAERENALELAHERKIKLMERNLELLKLSSERDELREQLRVLEDDIIDIKNAARAALAKAGVE